MARMPVAYGGKRKAPNQNRNLDGSERKEVWRSFEGRKNDPPQFYWDGFSPLKHLWFRCQHMREFVPLDPRKYTLTQPDPPTVKEQIYVAGCHCLGRIVAGEWCWEDARGADRTASAEFLRASP